MSKKKKTYKKKYTTKDRLDMSKGGRVGYQRGGPRGSRELEPMEPIENMEKHQREKNSM